MIKNLKYRLIRFIQNRRMQGGAQVKLMACALAAVTLLGSPIHTVEILGGQKFKTLNTVRPTVVAAKKSGTRFPVYITCGDETQKVMMSGGTVKKALRLAGFTPDKNDYAEPSLTTEITGTISIDFAEVEYVKTTKTKKTAYKTKTVYDKSKNKGYTKITQKGVKGKKKYTYTEKVVNGETVEKTVSAVKVLSKPKNAVKVVGTKTVKTKSYSQVNAISTLTPKNDITLDANGVPTSYKKKMTVRATAYTYTGNKCATGVAPQPGYIAVNPKVIPYGTKLYIKSPDGSITYGYAVAADTGGFIKNYPTGVDLFMTTTSACTNFGVRQMEIYILE